MSWLILLIPFALLMHVTVCVQVVHSGTTKSRITWRYACFTSTWQSGQQSKRRTIPRHRQLILGAFRHADRARRFLRQHIHLDRLDALILLHTGNAALTALLAEGLQSVACLPACRQKSVNIRILPDFFHGQTKVHAQCIIRVRMGIILLTMLMLLAQRLQRKARTAHGTSHW